ncbi:fibronectin type III domain-containing protein [Phytohabitans aurantiacus]|uniref:fibronectin type III domain-containing protein n=1 Tax=Phytohabitans aurantiacus TaxID=3016789 RepID=UPI002490A112|nr:tetratricopeptide repeat protein [Phytohabitans aurantiacus]
MSQPSPLAAAQQKAHALRDAGDLNTGRLMLDHALETYKPGLGDDHPEVLATAHALAGLHREAGDPASARRVLEEAYAAGQLRYGDGDPLMLAISFDLGGVAEELGNRHEARRAFGRVATAGPAVLGDDHWTVRAAREYLGDAPQSSEFTVSSEPQHNPPSITHLQLFQSPAPPQPPPHQPIPHPAPMPLPQPRYQSSQDPPRPQRRVRAATVAAMIAAAAAVLAAGFVGIQLFLDSNGGTPQTKQTEGPKLGGDPPTDLRLRDEGSVITITWKDPSDGAVPFIVAGAQAGKPHRAMANVSPGETSYTVNGLNARLSYCFTVVAYYSTDIFATSGQVCTDRSSPTPKR